MPWKILSKTLTKNCKLLKYMDIAKVTTVVS